MTDMRNSPLIKQHMRGYESLSIILARAYEQAAEGKGAKRHSVKAEPFEEQIICWLQRRGFDFARAQCVKKVDESLRMEPEAAIQELLGAINYLCAAIIVLEEKCTGKSKQGDVEQTVKDFNRCIDESPI